ncbi:MAG: ORF6N domain-containing protein [Pirellulaceae bacterium]
MSKTSSMLLDEQVESLILSIRGQKVLLDRDLAALYEVETKALNRAVTRNSERFPEDFMFELTSEEKGQVVASRPHLSPIKFSTVLPHAFTEHGAIMAASVLSSPRAAEASIFVVRAFVKLRQLLSSHKELAHKVAELERQLGDHDEAIQTIVVAIKQLMEPPPAPPATPRRKIGFVG